MRSIALGLSLAPGAWCLVDPPGQQYLPELPRLPGLPALPSMDPAPDLPDVALLYPLRPGGGLHKNTVRVAWSGDSIEESAAPGGSVLRLINGTVEVQDPDSGNITLKADLIEYDRQARRLRAVGGVAIDLGAYKMRCHSLEVEISDAGEGVILVGGALDVLFECPPAWTLQAKGVRFTSHPGDSMGSLGRLMGGGSPERTTELNFEKVSVTQCPGDDPGWVAHTSALKLKTGVYRKRSGPQGYASLDNITLKIGRVPVLWLPWVLFPASIDRAPGLLLPSAGYDDRLGAVLGMSWFQPLGKSVDVTLSPTWFSREGVMWGLESRWAPGRTHQGMADVKFIRPRSTGESRYRINLHEIWDMESGWMARADVKHASDQLMDAEFGSRGTTQPIGTPAYNSSLFVGKNFKWVAFSLFASDHRTYFERDDPFFLPDFPGYMQKIKIPEAQLRMYPVGVGKYYLDASARFGRLGYSLDLGPGPMADYYWSRADFQIRLQGRLGQWGPFRADFQVGARFTHYGAVLEDAFFDPEQPDGQGSSPINPIDRPDFDPFRVDGPGAHRRLGSSRIQVSTPQVGRAFHDIKLFGYSGDIKHILEPYIALTFNTKNDRAGVFPRFDEVDIRPGVGNSALGERSVQIGLKQHIFGRPDKNTMFADLVRANVSVKYYFDPVIMADGRLKQGWGSFDGNIDVEPGERLRLSFRRASEQISSETDTSLSADMEMGKSGRLSLALFSTGFNQLNVRQRGLRLGGGHRLWSDNLRVQHEVNYDYERKTFSFSQVKLTYSARCLEYSLRYYHLALPIASRFAKEDRLDFILSFGGLGDLFSTEVGGLFTRMFK